MKTALRSFAFVAIAIACPTQTSRSAEPTNPEAASAGRSLETRGVGATKLPLPSSLSVHDYEAELFRFLNERRYVKLGWKRDKQVRDTGPFVNGKDYGTHPAVRIYYSPEIIDWLVSGRTGEIPDGAMMVKEQYQAPAVRHEHSDDAALWDSLRSWTVMVKDHAGSHDGWFWSNPAKDQEPVDSYSYPFEEPISGFGLYCVRCHASAQSPAREDATKPKPLRRTNEYTFASLRNIEGFPGQPLLFRVDDSWRTDPQQNKQTVQLVTNEIENKLKTLAQQVASSHPRCTQADQPARCEPHLNLKFLQAFPSVRRKPRDEVLHIPPVTYDSVHRLPQLDVRASANRENSAAGASQNFLTSNQCMSCHAGITEPFGPSMFIPTGKEASYGAEGLHVSPFGEWRWTPMGLAGRDPVFYAQLASEKVLIEREFPPDEAEAIGTQLTQTCLSCHGVMGKRQHDLDLATSPGSHNKLFNVGHLYNTSSDPHAVGHSEFKYGALARDGVSCTVCHQIQPRPQPEGDNRPYLQHFLATSITGNFYTPEKFEIYGPFKDNEIAPYVMEHAIGVKPKHHAFLKSSQMCGTCHTVNLPSIDRLHKPNEAEELIEAEANPLFKKFHHHVEQATYLEWLNSEYENEFKTENVKAKSCQDCHMSKGIVHEASGTRIDQIQTRIATIQDATFPDAENLASHEDLNIRLRTEGYRRHNFRGLNAFLVEMFNQFDDILGVRKVDYMTGSKQDLALAMDDFSRQARHQTAQVQLDAAWVADRDLQAVVTIVNQAGHRFPSGVGFRRAFLELTVRDTSSEGSENSQVLWASGRTNSIGQIIGHDGQPLVTEFFEEDRQTGRQLYQPHHEVITHPDQVQIYETLLCNAKKQLTTSFVHGCDIIKDNRFLPKGWSKEGPDPALTGEFLKATYPGPLAIQDARYVDGSGSDQITYRITLPRGIDPKKVKVSARLFYQAIPPYFLKNLFDIAPDAPAVQRLHYLCSNMNLDGTIIEDWKLLIGKATADLSRD